jgi:hypothetical protein
MTFTTFVQVGRAVLIASGPEKGKLGVIGMNLRLPLTNSAVEIISEKSVYLHSTFYRDRADFILGAD